MTPKAKRTLRLVKEAIENRPLGATIDDIYNSTKLSMTTIRNTLAQLPTEQRGDEYFLLDEQATKTAPKADLNENAQEKPVTNQATVKKIRNKPFTPNPTRGYEIKKDKVKIFLDRRTGSKVLTLSLSDLKELVNAIEKSEYVA